MSAVELILDAPAARALTDRIKIGVEAVWDLITQAYTERAWAALGYSSWDDYCTREFGTARLRLPREERAEVVASLRESGLSIRAIASATGTGTRQVQEAIREQRQVCSQTTPDPEPDEDALAEELIAVERQLPPLPENYVNTTTDGPASALDLDNPRHDANVIPVVPEPKAITGLDGKTYQPTALKSRRKPIAEDFIPAVLQLTKVTGRIESISTDNRFKDSDQIAQRISDLVRARDALQRVIDRFTH